MTRAGALGARGRHAAAERMLRELAGALARRRAVKDAATVLIRLGCLQSERGRAAAAARALESAVALAEESEDVGAVAESKVWLAAMRADLRQLAEAEALCRDVRRSLTADDDLARWATAVLARVSLWQARHAEARALVDDLPRVDVVDERSAFVEATAVRVLLGAGDVFAAGLRLAGLPEAGAEMSLSPLAQVIVAIARLRFRCAAGDLSRAEHEYGAVRRLARAARAPLRAVRAGLVWVEALQRAGQDARAAREWVRLGRVNRCAPPLLKDRLHRGIRPVAVTSMGPAERPPVARLAGLAEPGPDSEEEDALASAAGRALDGVGARRLVIVAAEGATPLAAIGEGPLPSSAGQALQSGTTLGPIDVDGGQEVAVPIRWDGRVVAVLAARWDRAPAEATPWLTAAAAILAARVVTQARSRRDELLSTTLIPGLLGRSAAMAALRAAIVRAGPAPFAVLIHGESGVGKELVARALHAMSTRHAHRMCDVNCAALPDDLLEAELFGHVRGAFTGAVGDRTGLFEDAHGGTLFLDEVVDLSARAQAKLLRVLQQQEVKRLGESRPRRIDVRIVSAANRDPREAVAAGAFRPDLVYRLDVIRISVPPLRERREDVAELAEHFWGTAARGVGSRAALGRDALEALTAYHWPGNVRELQNVLASMAVAAPREGRIGVRHLPPHLRTRPREDPPACLADLRRECDHQAVVAALARTAGHRGRAARELGLSRQGLLKLMARVGVHPRKRT